MNGCSSISTGGFNDWTSIDYLILCNAVYLGEFYCHFFKSYFILQNALAVGEPLEKLELTTHHLWVSTNLYLMKTIIVID